MNMTTTKKPYSSWRIDFHFAYHRWHSIAWFVILCVCVRAKEKSKTVCFYNYNVIFYGYLIYQSNNERMNECNKLKSNSSRR